MQFEIKPYEGALPLRFGMSEVDVIELLGEPHGKSTNFRGDRVFDYPWMNVGFGSDGRVAHIGFVPGGNVVFRGRDVFQTGAFEELVRLDGAAKEVVGLVVLLNLGIAFSGFHDCDPAQKAVTVFIRGAYDRLKGRMKPFQL